jgi:hypothetical protein
MGARWVEYAVQKLVANGHRFLEIPDYSLQQVVILLDAIEKEAAATRSNELRDLAVTISGVLGGSSQFAEHLEEVDNAQFEEQEDGQQRREPRRTGERDR